MLKRRTKQTGDTLIEVLLAFSIFAMAVTTITRAMNDGYARMFSSGQQSQVQSLMRGQLALIQAAHDTEVKTPNAPAWDNIIKAIALDGPTKAANTQKVVNPDGCTYTLDKNRLFFNTAEDGVWTDVQKVDAVPASTDQSAIPDGVTPSPDGTSLWIEAKYTPPTTDPVTLKQSRGFYDFYAKACWTDKVQRQLKTVARLYDLVIPTGEGSHLTALTTPATPPVPPPLATSFEWDGGDHVQLCTPAPSGVCSNHPYPDEASAVRDVLFSCWAFRGDYELPEQLEPGNYRLTIAYTNMGGGQYAYDNSYWFNCTATNGFPAGYPGFIVDYYVNGALKKSNVQLQAATGFMGVTTTTDIYIDNPIGATGPRIGVDWINDAWDGTGVKDANMGIYRLKLEKQ